MFENLNGLEQPDLVVIDTDILIDAGRCIDEAVKCLQQIEQNFSAVVSSVTQMELIIGCRNKVFITGYNCTVRGYISGCGKQITIWKGNRRCN